MAHTHTSIRGRAPARGTRKVGGGSRSGVPPLSWLANPHAHHRSGVEVGLSSVWQPPRGHSRHGQGGCMYSRAVPAPFSGWYPRRPPQRFRVQETVRNGLTVGDTERGGGGLRGVWLLPRAFVWGAGGSGSGGKCGWRTPPTHTPGAARLGAVPQWAWHWGATIGGDTARGSGRVERHTPHPPTRGSPRWSRRHAQHRRTAAWALGVSASRRDGLGGCGQKKRWCTQSGTAMIDTLVSSTLGAVGRSGGILSVCPLAPVTDK